MEKDKRIKEARMLPLPFEERLDKLEEKFDLQCRQYELKAVRFLVENIPETAPDFDEILLETKKRMWSRWVKVGGQIPCFSTYFCRAIYNMGFNWLKRKKTGRRNTPLYYLDSKGSEYPLEITSLTAVDNDPSVVEEALDAVPEPYRSTLVAWVELQSEQEVAKALNVPVGTVKSRLSRGRALLFQELEKHGLNSGFTYENISLNLNDTSSGEKVAATAK